MQKGLSPREDSELKRKEWKVQEPLPGTDSTVARGSHGREDRTGRLMEEWAGVEVSLTVQGSLT